MRVFYDVYVSRRRAETALFLADALAVSAAVLFATGLPGTGDRATDAVLAAVWALVPRCVAGWLARTRRPRDFFRSFVFSFVLGLGVAFLGFAGWDLIHGSVAVDVRPRPETTLVVLLAWTSGFFLCVPRAYRLHDFLLVSVLLLGLLERRPLPLLWVPVALGGLAFSWVTRRLVYEIFPRGRRARINLQNARVVAVVAAAAASLLFAGTLWALWDALDRRAPQDSRWAPRWNLTGPAAPGEAGGDGTLRRGGRSGGRGPRGSLWGSGGENGGGRGGPGGPGKEGGYSLGADLDQIENARLDRTPVFAARTVDAEGRELDTRPRGWPPAVLLWRGASLTRFDPEELAWIEPAAPEERSWPADGVVRRTPPAGSGPPVRLEVVVLAPKFRTLVTPYFPRTIGPVRPRPPGSYWLEGRGGEVTPAAPPVRRGTRYALWFRAGPGPGVPPSVRPRSAAPDEGDDVDADLLHVPEPGTVGVDLERLARRLELHRGTIRARVDRLEAFIHEGFRYHDRAFWKGGPDRLARFLEEDRRGDCTYFATAGALLLRAGGVATRVAVGYRGGSVDPRRPTRVLVRNALAHAWVEVRVAGMGWYPIDPTAWARPDEGWTPPEDLQAGWRPSRTSGEDALAGLGGRDVDGAVRDGQPEPSTPRETPGERSAPQPGDPGSSPAPEDGDDGFDVFSIPLPEDGARGAESSWLLAGSPRRGIPEAASQETDGDREAAGERATAWSWGPPETLSRGLRFALLALALLAAGLLIAVRFRPRTDRSEEEEDDDDEEDDDERAGPDPAACRAALAGATGPVEQVLLAYHELQLELERTRNHRRPPETPVEHGRGHRGQDPELDAAFHRLHQCVYAALYAGRACDTGTVARAREACSHIRRRLG